MYHTNFIASKNTVFNVIGRKNSSLIGLLQGTFLLAHLTFRCIPVLKRVIKKYVVRKVPQKCQVLF